MEVRVRAGSAPGPGTGQHAAAFCVQSTLLTPEFEGQPKPVPGRQSRCLTPCCCEDVGYRAVLMAGLALCRTLSVALQMGIALRRGVLEERGFPAFPSAGHGTCAGAVFAGLLFHTFKMSFLFFLRAFEAK